MGQPPAWQVSMHHASSTPLATSFGSAIDLQPMLAHGTMLPLPSVQSVAFAGAFRLPPVRPLALAPSAPAAVGAGAAAGLPASPTRAASASAASPAGKYLGSGGGSVSAGVGTIFLVRVRG